MCSQNWMLLPAARGEPLWSDCASLTANVDVPGLELVLDFVSQEEEEALIAVLMGPLAPWALLQSMPTMIIHVKCCVEHYGCVLDYETSDMLLDQTKKVSISALTCTPT